MYNRLYVDKTEHITWFQIVRTMKMAHATVSHPKPCIQKVLLLNICTFTHDINFGQINSYQKVHWPIISRQKQFT